MRRFDRWAARRMLIALHMEAATVKSDDQMAIEAFLWRQADELDVAWELEGARLQRAIIRHGVIVKQPHPGHVWVLIDGNPDIHEMPAVNVPFDPDDRITIIDIDSQMTAVVNDTFEARSSGMFR